MLAPVTCLSVANPCFPQRYFWFVPPPLGKFQFLFIPLLPFPDHPNPPLEFPTVMTFLGQIWIFLELHDKEHLWDHIFVVIFPRVSFSCSTMTDIVNKCEEAYNLIQRCQNNESALVEEKINIRRLVDEVSALLAKCELEPLETNNLTYYFEYDIQYTLENTIGEIRLLKPGQKG